MTAPDAVVVPKRGRPRSETADEKILAATAALIVERGYEALTIDGVARCSGVAKTTIYRRWASKQDLVLATMGHATSDLHAVDTGTLRGDLISIVGYFADRLTSPSFGPLLRAMQLAVAEKPELAAAATGGFLAERRQEVDVVIDRALARGELAPGADREVVFDLCIGSLFMRVMVTGRPISTELVDRIVDTVLLGYPNVPPS